MQSKPIFFFTATMLVALCAAAAGSHADAFAVLLLASGPLVVATGGAAADLEDLTYDELTERLLAVKNRCDKIQADADKDGRDLTEREARRVEDAFAEFETIEAEIKTRPEQHQTRAQAAAATTKARAGAGRKTSHDVAGPFATRTDRDEPTSPRNGMVFAAGTKQFSASLFGAAPSRSAGEWKNGNEFLAAVASGRYDPRLQMRNDLGANESVGQDGGFAVPTIWYSGIVDQALQQAEFAQRCRIFPASSNTLMVPMVDTTHQDDGVAGLIAHWAAEARDQNLQRLKWRAAELKLNKTFILAEASSELVEDGVNYEAQLNQAMSLATAQTLDAGILYGTGVGMPLGVINSSSAIEIPKEAGQAADTVVWQNLVRMWSRLTAASRKRATWFVSSSLLPSLMAVKVPDTDAPALLSGGSNDAGAGAPVMQIFGRPVVTTDIASAGGDRGDIVLADFSQYALLMKRSARLESDAGPGFSRDVMAFRMILRVGGQPLWTSPITPFNSGPTLSWAAYLAERA